MTSWFLIVGFIAVTAGYLLASTLAGGEFRLFRRRITRREQPGVFWLVFGQYAMILALSLFMVGMAAPYFGM